jgi:superfamily II DNA or RNA helicase
MHLPIKDMVAKGYLVPASVYMVQCSRDTFKWTKQWQVVYKKGVTDNKYRNSLIGITASRLLAQGHKVFIMVKTILHGKELNTLLKQREINSIFYHGADNTEDDDIKLMDAIKHYDVVIATTGLSVEGLDMPEITAMINAAGGRSTWWIRQLIGRGLRLAPGKKKLVFFDFFDMTHAFLRAQSIRRQKIYEADGHEVNIAPIEKINWEGL